MSYEFGDALYPSRSIMLSAIVTQWLTADGMNSREAVQEYLDSHDNAEIAQEIITAWALDTPPDGPGDDAQDSHMAREGYDAGDVAGAVGEYRARFARVQE